MAGQDAVGFENALFQPAWLAVDIAEIVFDFRIINRITRKKAAGAGDINGHAATFLTLRSAGGALSEKLPQAPEVLLHVGEHTEHGHEAEIGRKVVVAAMGTVHALRRHLARPV